jgi:hypothetical protein
MQDEWTSAALSWLEQMRGSGAAAFDPWIDEARREPLAWSLAVVALVLVSLCRRSLKKARSMEQRNQTVAAECATLAGLIEKERKWRLADEAIKSRLNASRVQNHDPVPAPAREHAIEMPGENLPSVFAMGAGPETVTADSAKR